MATCKDCIHFASCKNLYETHGEGLSEDSYTCDYFKSRSRFVELPFETKGEVYFIGQLSKMIFLNSKQAEQALKEREGQ